MDSEFLQILLNKLLTYGNGDKIEVKSERSCVHLKYIIDSGLDIQNGFMLTFSEDYKIIRKDLISGRKFVLTVVGTFMIEIHEDGNLVYSGDIESCRKFVFDCRGCYCVN